MFSHVGGPVFVWKSFLLSALDDANSYNKSVQAALVALTEKKVEKKA